jgi:DNA replication and repair protein RecF
MRVQHLSLTDFRSYQQIDVPFFPGVNVLVGSNGQGKTNLVEAIGYAATATSHRVATDAPLIRWGADHAVLRVEAVCDSRPVLVEIAINPGRANKARLNRAAVPRVGDALGIIRVVTFAPEDLALVKGDPGERRRFLDDLLVQQRPRLLAVRSDYDRVLKQRNALLKTIGTARRAQPEEIDRTLSVWNEQLASVGSHLVAERVRVVGELVGRARDSYQGIAEDDRRTLGMAYSTAMASHLDDPAVPLSTEAAVWREAMMRAITARQRDEIQRGITLVGPQRDDLLLTLGDTPAKGYASHGEAWSIALSLRLACFELLRRDQDEPILILDDVFAELDSRRRTHLVAAIRSAEQVIITAAVQEDVPAGLEGRQSTVAHGQVISR